MIYAGVDIGSTTTKCVLMNDSQILVTQVTSSGIKPADTARNIFDECCQTAEVDSEKVDIIATTGYGRRLAGFGDIVLTEIKACSLGAQHSYSAHDPIGTIIDVGGQDTKVMTIGADGEVEDFSMNDKCAAGTGRFLEMLAGKLSLSYEDFVTSALGSKTTIQMNSTCAVFAESEVISLLARGVANEDIAAAAHNAIAQRIASMVRRVGHKPPFCIVGGGARNGALVRAIEESLGETFFVPDNPQCIIALGAAVAAARKVKKVK